MGRCRSMAAVAGYAPSTIHRIWQTFGLNPHRTETFTLSNDPLFVEKVRDIVGLSIAPPDRALVLAVLHTATGTVIGRCYPKHCSIEFRKFLDQIEANDPADPDDQLVMDIYATHKTTLIRDWLAKRPRRHVHFSPTGASWINQVERFFALVTENQIRRGVHNSTKALEADIRAFIEIHNTDPKPFR